MIPGDASKQKNILVVPTRGLLLNMKSSKLHVGPDFKIAIKVSISQNIQALQSVMQRAPVSASTRGSSRFKCTSQGELVGLSAEAGVKTSEKISRFTLFKN